MLGLPEDYLRIVDGGVDRYSTKIVANEKLMARTSL